ncbi:MAG: helix-turn-helix domain-containing protein [Hylemonella sp.]
MHVVTACTAGAPAFNARRRGKTAARQRCGSRQSPAAPAARAASRRNAAPRARHRDAPQRLHHVTAARAARQLGIGRNTIYRKLKRLRGPSAPS